mmetsp:Transcript_11608/g.11631  ORF Transcript_11608/g.11631 Transcript_11608/m.11631 type:complete len:125 (+) Transcript_11608:453-827(+)
MSTELPWKNEDRPAVITESWKLDLQCQLKLQLNEVTSILSEFQISKISYNDFTKFKDGDKFDVWLRIFETQLERFKYVLPCCTNGNITNPRRTVDRNDSLFIGEMGRKLYFAELALYKKFFRLH